MPFIQCSNLWIWNGNTNQPEVLQQKGYHYGMVHSQKNARQTGVTNNYQFNKIIIVENESVKDNGERNSGDLLTKLQLQTKEKERIEYMDLKLKKIAKTFYYISFVPLVTLSLFYLCIGFILLKEGTLSEDFTGLEVCDYLGFYNLCSISNNAVLFSILFSPIIFLITFFLLKKSKLDKVFVRFSFVVIISIILYLVTHFTELFWWFGD